MRIHAFETVREAYAAIGEDPDVRDGDLVMIECPDTGELVAVIVAWLYPFAVWTNGSADAERIPRAATTEELWARIRVDVGASWSDQKTIHAVICACYDGRSEFPLFPFSN